MNVIYSATSTIYLHVKQTEGTETANVSFDLGAATMEYGNNAPYYNWGRKDPMVTVRGLNTTNKPIYGAYTVLDNMSTTDIATTIRTPYYFNTNSGNPSLELWNVGSTSNANNVLPVTKSIYDPSPTGFHLPCSGAFQGWEEAGRSYWQNTTGKWGRYFYQLGPTTGNTVFFPALGYRSNTNAVGEIGERGYFMTSGAASSDTGWRMDFSPSGVTSQYSSNRYYGFSIRSVAE